jgi:hypothetical protein
MPIREMHPKIQTAIGALLHQIGKVNATEEDLIAVEKIMPEAHIWIDYEVNVTWPVKSFDEVKHVLAKFAREGFMLKEYNKSDTHPSWTLKGKNCSIRLSPTWQQEETKEEGVTCRLVRVGTETVEQPIFKLMCSSADGETI